MRTKIIRAAVLAASLALPVVLPFTAASAAPRTPPAVKTIQNDAPAPWAFTTKPGTILTGNGGTPIAFHLTWSSWTDTSATATGKLDLWDTSCTPIANCKPSVYSVTILLHRAAAHKGTEYFSRMRYSYGRKGGVLYFYEAAGLWQERAASPPVPVACHPLAPSGNCYEPGEFCPGADLGMTGIAGDGKTIVCKVDGSYHRWLD